MHNIESGQTKLLDYRIRSMQMRDIPAVAALEAQTFSMPWSEQGFADALAQTDNIFLVAELADETIVAYCGLYAAGEEGEITNVAVSDTLRRIGVGFSIVSELLKQARQQGICAVFLEVRQSNETAHRLYERAGFTDCGIRKNFYERPKEDAVVMEWRTDR
jgi:ribosomal-protein-alanine N-acetyltransferase